jgi:hypothetical protein
MIFRSPIFNNFYCFPYLLYKNCSSSENYTFGPKLVSAPKILANMHLFRLKAHREIIQFRVTYAFVTFIGKHLSCLKILRKIRLVSTCHKEIFAT